MAVRRQAMPPRGSRGPSYLARRVQAGTPFDAPLCSATATWPRRDRAHNAEFETKFFARRYPVICTYKAALRVWPTRRATATARFGTGWRIKGKIAPDHALTQPAHRAGPDAYVTAHILLALFDTGATGREMIAWTKEPRLLPTCPIGKFRGKPWPEVEAGFLGWMLRQPTMEEDLKWNAEREIARRAQQGAKS
jgi:exodeoxyribonuclease X